METDKTTDVDAFGGGGDSQDNIMSEDVSAPPKSKARTSLASQLKIALLFLVCAGYFVGVLMWSREMSRAHDHSAREINYAGRLRVTAKMFVYATREFLVTSNATEQSYWSAKVRAVATSGSSL